MNDEVNNATRQEWRALGFFYNRDDDTRTWKIVGSRTGLLRFRDALREYVGDARNARDSEHAHFGPYMYLKIMTWPQPRLDRDGISGPLCALKHLADVADGQIATAPTGATIDIGREFAVDGPYTLKLEMQEDGFDPAQADPALHDRLANDRFGTAARDQDAGVGEGGTVLASGVPIADIVGELVARLNGANADGAWHSLVELGAPGVSHLARLFESTTDEAIGISILTVAGQIRTTEAVDLLSRGLASESGDTWKAALDGLVSLGGREASQAIARAYEGAPTAKRAWLEEAATQLSKGTAT